MKRTKKVVAVEEPTVEKPIVYPVTVGVLFKKIGGGTMRWNNRIIKPGEKFVANPDELPKAFMPSLQCLEPEKLKNWSAIVEKETQTPEVLYKLKKLKDGTYNIVNEQKKAINEEPLTLEEAEEMLTALNK